MAVTSRSASGLTGVTAADGTRSDETRVEGKPFDGNCVVDDGTPHTGRATPGARICSAHAMRYRADGTPR